MPLQLAERAALALWLAAARLLDAECCAATSEAERRWLDAAREVVQHGAKMAAFEVRTGDGVGPYLRGVAVALAERCAEPGCPPQLGAARAWLERQAEACINCVDGDGPLDDATTPCPCGVLGLAALVEGRLHRLVAAVERGNLAGGLPRIAYATAFEANPAKLLPFRVDGKTLARREPRQVWLVLAAPGMTARDLWHLAYTLHHELVCHGFQAAFTSVPAPNADQNCAWSEGWMDTVACDLVLQWLESGAAPADWLPLGGDEAKAAVIAFHDRRYTHPPGLTPSQRDLRARSRAAFRRLEAALLANDPSLGPDGARQAARAFSLALNLRAGCDVLAEFGDKLRIALLSRAREELAVEAAVICRAFLAAPNLEALRRALDALVPDE